MTGSWHAPTYEELKAEYLALWNELTIKAGKVAEIDGIVATILRNRARYATVEQATGVPWFVVALIHSMEASLNFRSHLHNGDPLTARTVHVPKGRPVSGNPPFTWEQSATDALQFDGLTQIHDWPVARIAYALEGFNGWGYRHYHADVKSPYLWSYTNHYVSGKYTSDGKWSQTAVSAQCGAMALLRRLADKNADVKAALGGAARETLPVLVGMAAGSLLFPGGANEPPWVKAAKGELGQRDYPGPDYNPRVVEYLRTTGHQANDDETSWCSAFANWCMKQSGRAGTNDAGARSWLNYGQGLSEPRPGCIVVMWRESPQSWKGHVGFFDGWDVGDRVRILGGNQGGGVDWDEVCVTTFPKERILRFRWPDGA